MEGELGPGDVGLARGGEPPLVSIDDMKGRGWNTTAMSPKKLALSIDLLKRLKPRFTSGSMLHFGQGKWYPGEPLPRWALSCYWRPDGVAVWQDESLIAMAPAAKDAVIDARLRATHQSTPLPAHQDGRRGHKQGEPPATGHGGRQRSARHDHSGDQPFDELAGARGLRMGRRRGGIARGLARARRIWRPR